MSAAWPRRTVWHEDGSVGRWRAAMSPAPSIAVRRRRGHCIGSRASAISKGRRRCGPSSREGASGRSRQAEIAVGRCHAERREPARWWRDAQRPRPPVPLQHRALERAPSHQDRQRRLQRRGCSKNREGWMVLRERIELSTSSLPMRCSTTELPQRGSGGRGRRRTGGGISGSDRAWQRSRRGSRRGNSRPGNRPAGAIVRWPYGLLTENRGAAIGRAPRPAAISDRALRHCQSFRLR